MVGVGVVLLRPPIDGAPAAVLLVRRGKPPAMGSWSLPGGAQELGETAEDAARRELAEETGLTAGPLVLAANVDSIHRNPEGRVQFHYTILDFAGWWQAGAPSAGSDVTDAVFAPLDDLGRFELWSEAHRVIGLACRLLSSVSGGTETPCRS
jgi:ADP-ribose pyrophosphatase YjhB (NUDIX family)